MSAENKNIGEYHVNKKQIAVSALSGVATGVVVLNLGPVGFPAGLVAGSVLYAAGTMLTGLVNKQADREVKKKLEQYRETRGFVNRWED